MDEQDEESYSLCLVTNNKTNSKRKLSAISKNNKKQKKNENVFSDEHRLDEFEDDDEAEDTESSDEFNTSEDDDDESPFVKPKKKKKQQHVYIDETIDDDQIMQDVPSDDNHVAGAESLEQKVTRCLRELRPLENDFDFNEATRIEEDKLLHMLDVMLELWSPSEIHDKNSRMNAIEYIVSRCLGVDPARDPNPCEVHELIETNISAPVFSLRLRLSNEGLLNPEENDNASEILSKLAKIQDLVKFASESYRYSVLATHRARNASFDIPEQWVGLLSYMPREQLQEMKDFEKYLFYILQSLHLKKFRRYKDSVYEPIYTKEGYFTNAWKKHSTIEQYVWQCVDLDTQAHISGFMFSRGVTNPEHAIKILKVFKTSYFPDLEPVRYLSSWRNGIWNLAESKFYPYSSNPLTDVNTDDSNFEEDNDPERITIFKEHIQPEITQHEKNLSIKKNDLRIKSRLEHWKRFSEYAKVAPLGDVRLCLDLLRKADENPQYESTLDASRLQIQHNTKLKQKNKMPNIFIPSKRCSNIYIDDEFIDQSNVPWPQMPTPTFQSILDMQDFDDETCRWIYALLGRALYFCGDMNQV